MLSSFSLFDFGCWLVVFLLSMSAHEASHAYIAKVLGDPTAYLGGQVTLDPIPHIRREPFGMLLLPIISYLASGWMIGWASAPYNAAWAAQYPRRAAVMALAGPAPKFCYFVRVWVWTEICIVRWHFCPRRYRTLFGNGGRRAIRPTAFGGSAPEPRVFLESPPRSFQFASSTSLG